MQLSRGIGFKGWGLVGWGLFVGLIGVGTILRPVNIPNIFYTTWPLWLKAGMWIVPGVIALLCALFQRLHIVGFIALIIPMCVVIVSLLLALGSDPAIRLNAVAIYLLLAFNVMLISAWPEPVQTNGTAADVAALRFTGDYESGKFTGEMTNE